MLPRYGYDIFKYIILLILISTPIHANDTAENNAGSNNALVPKDLAPAFEHLLSHADQSSRNKLNSEQIANVIDFVNSAKDLNRTYSMGQRNGASSSYYEFNLNRSFQEVLDLVYNPDIPSYIVIPASVRRSKWIQVNGKKQKLPKLSDYLKGLLKPVLIKGVEFIENTPDTFSGAYYAYELDRALLLARHKGQMVLISISRQRDKSEVGKKGLVLGSDDNWDYLYTGEKGCTRSGLGWVDSYLYDSASIAVYYEVNGEAPTVRCGVFKWLRAGWAGINMVKPRHIRDGVIRFAKPFKHIIESPIIENTEKLTNTFRQINALPEDELRKKVQKYYLYLKDTHKNPNRIARKWFDRLSGNNGHVAKMDQEEMKACLAKAYVKHLLGKSPGIDINFFSPTAKDPQNREQLKIAIEAAYKPLSGYDNAGREHGRIQTTAQLSLR